MGLDQRARCRCCGVVGTRSLSTRAASSSAPARRLVAETSEFAQSHFHSSFPLILLFIFINPSRFLLSVFQLYSSCSAMHLLFSFDFIPFGGLMYFSLMNYAPALLGLIFSSHKSEAGRGSVKGYSHPLRGLRSSQPALSWKTRTSRHPSFLFMPSSKKLGTAQQKLDKWKTKMKIEKRHQ